MKEREAALEKTLKTPIDPHRAPPCGLRRVFCHPADRSDVEQYVGEEFVRKINAIDAYFAIEQSSQNDRLWLRRILALFVGHQHSQVSDSNLGFKLFLLIAPEKYRGFSIARVGRPRKWTNEDCIALVVDVENIKTKYPDLEGEKLFGVLRRKCPTWKPFGIPALRKAYSKGVREIRKYPVPKVARGSAADFNYKAS